MKSFRAAVRFRGRRVESAVDRFPYTNPRGRPMFRRLLACVMTAGLVFGGAAPVLASEAAPTAGSVAPKNGKSKTGKKKGKKGTNKGKKKGKKGAAKKGSPKKGGTKKGKKG